MFQNMENSNYFDFFCKLVLFLVFQIDGAVYFLNF